MMWLAVLILLSTTNIIDCKAQHPLFESFEVPVFNPKPSSGSLVKPNAVARFSILTERLIRLEFDESGIFRNLPSFAVVNRYIKPPPFLIEYPGNGRMIVKTKYLTLSYAYQHNNSFTDDSLSIEFLHSNGTTSTWKPSMDPAEGNLRGTVRNLDNYYKAPDLDCRFETDPNQHCTLGLISRTGWTLIDDTFTPRLEPPNSLNATFDFPWILNETVRDEPTKRDWYFLGYGLDYKAALEQWTLVSGKIPMIPRYALGSWSSRYWAYNEAEFLRVVQTYHQNRVPLDVLVVDMDWHKTFYAVDGGQWTGWTWDPLLFSDERRFLSVLKEMGIRVTVNLHPADGVMAHEDVYPEIARRLGYSNNVTIPFQSTNTTFMKEFFELVIGNIEKDGIEFFWLDWQQGESWQKWTGIDGLNPTLWLNYVFWKHSELAHPSIRPLNFHRWGGLGNHRYPIGFSGDTFPSWEMLTSQIKFTVTSSNVLFGYWSHDLGGHMTTSEPELYTRWVQFGAWSPIFRTHSTKSGNNVRYFWKYPRGESDVMTRAVYGRMELLPYIYSMAKVAHDCGVSLLRPLYYEFPEMEEAYLRGSEYYFGDLFVVAPIAKAVDANGLVEVDLWVPPGEWLEMGTGRVLNGPFVHSGHYLLEDVPVLVKSGAIVPKSLMDDTKYFGLASEIPRHLVIEIFMGQALNGNFSLYEDDGLTSDYDNPERQLNTLLTYKREAKDVVSISITPKNGILSGISGRRAYRLKFLQTVGIKSVQVNAVDIDCSKLCAFRSQEMAAYVDIGEFEIDQKLDIVVQFSSPLTQVPDGLLVKRNRMLKAKDMLDNQWELEEPYIYQDYYASLLKSLSFIQAAEFNPLEAGELLKKADALYGNVVAEVAQIVEGRGEALGYILDILTKL